MNPLNSLSRFTEYFKRHGLGATVRRIGLAVRQSIFSNRMVLFYCDLATLGSTPISLPSSLNVERVKSLGELSSQDLEEITSFWNPEQAKRNINERFALGASLWLIRKESKLAGYGWTLQGRTVEPHYFPLGADDVQFLDFHIFPKYRGRGIDWCLMTCILNRLSEEGRARAFGEAAEWNKASLASFAMTPFRFLGTAQKYSFLGRTVVRWARHETVLAGFGSRARSDPAARLKASGLADSAREASEGAAV